MCCQKRSAITVCGECKEHYCVECIDAHTCGYHTVCWAHEKGLPLTCIDVKFSCFALCGVLCREGLRSTLVYLGDSRGG